MALHLNTMPKFSYVHVAVLVAALLLCASAICAPDEYDVIVVGAGLTGSTVSSEIAKHGLRVLVLEAGAASHRSLGGNECPARYSHRRRKYTCWTPKDTSKDALTRYDVPFNYGAMQCWDSKCSHANWNRNIPAYQAKILGGGGALNGALAQYPPTNNFDTWPTQWSYEWLKPYLDEVKEEYSIGPISSADGKRYLEKTGSSFLRLLSRRAGFKDSRDALVITPRTTGWPAVFAKDGVRESSASKNLPGALERDNFELQLEAEVTKLEFCGDRVKTVKYMQGGVEKHAKLDKTGVVVLTAGTMNTARLLLRSGVGPHDAVAYRKAKIVNNGVGRNVSDHTYWSTYYSLTWDAFEVLRLNPPARKYWEQYMRNRSGPIAQFGPTRCSFYQDKATRSSNSDVEICVSSARERRRIRISFALLKPMCSHANVRISADNSAKLEYANYRLHLGCDRDREIMNRAVDFVDVYMRKLGGKRTSLSTPRSYDMNHMVGTCALGRCVDSMFLTVFGTANVKVADASLVPHQIWAHPMFTLLALAKKASHHILAGLRCKRSERCGSLIKDPTDWR